MERMMSVEDKIRTNCEIVLQGNCDVHFSTEHKNIDEMNEQEQKRIKWNQSLIDKEDREYLLNLPFCYELYMSGSLVRLFHATPTVNNKVLHIIVWSLLAFRVTLCKVWA